MHPAQEHIQAICPLPAIPGYRFHLSSQLLETKLATYSLIASDLSGTYALDQERLQHVLASLEGQDQDCLKPLVHCLFEWPQTLSWNDFVERINELSREWLGCYVANITIDAASRLVQCLELKTGIFRNASGSLHLLLTGLLSDVSLMYERHRYHFVISHDTRTALPNARTLHDQLEKEIRLHPDVTLGLLVISFNSTSRIGQDSQLSPWLLDKAVSMLQESLDVEYQLYQLAYAEFAVLAPSLADPVKLPLLAAKIQRAFEQILHQDNRPFLLNPTIVWTLRDPHSMASSEALYWQAQVTLQDAVSSGKRQQAYSSEIAQRNDETGDLKKRVVEAFENDQFELYLQPIIDISGTAPLIAEALLRWPTSGSPYEIQPTFLVNVLYEQGFGKRYCRWLINTVFRMNRELRSELQQPVRLSLNLCAEDLLDPELPYLIQQSLSLWQVRADEITLEITENGILLDEEMAYKVLQALSALGCKLALDDFGTGYSSMSRLRNLPVDVVKIDQSFVRTIASSVQDAEIVRSIIVLAQGLGKDIVAEGIEDEESRDTLVAMECPVMQGYLYSRPVPFHDYIHWAKQYLGAI